MNKTVLKIFMHFTFAAANIALLVFVLNIIGFSVLQSESGYGSIKHPKRILAEIAESAQSGNILDKSKVPRNCWCILLDDRGDVINSANMPSDIPTHYTLKDIARIKGWFLSDYPVYIRIENQGIYILGLPKNSVGKYDLNYSGEWFAALPLKILGIIADNFLLALFFSFIYGKKLYKSLKMLFDGISDLEKEKSVNLPESGILKELCSNINKTSQSIERKNRLLEIRDNARNEWISGISHDIRTPLFVAAGNAEAIENAQIPHQYRQKAANIKRLILKIKKLIEDMELISSLEYDMQPLKAKKIRLCPIIRTTVADIMNDTDDEKYSVELELNNEEAEIYADENLMERAIFNLINNSIIHNEKGCNITIKQYVKDNKVFTEIRDNGCGVPKEVIDNINKMPRSAHGLGLPMVYKIVTAHKGRLYTENNKGFIAVIELPLEK